VSGDGFNFTHKGHEIHVWKDRYWSSSVGGVVVYEGNVLSSSHTGAVRTAKRIAEWLAKEE
jgi:hypothetical protein